MAADELPPEGPGRARSELYRDLVERSGHGLWVLDGAGTTVFANQRTGELLGVAHDSMPGRDIADFLDEVGREQWLAHLARGASAVTGSPIPCLFVRPDGTPVWLLACESRLPREGRGQDANDRGDQIVLSLTPPEHSERFENDLETSRQDLLDAQRIGLLGSWAWHAERRVLVLSPTVADVVGEPFSRQLAGLARPATEAGDPAEAEIREELSAIYRPLLDGRVDSLTHELSLADDHEQRTVRIRAEAVRDEDGDLVSLSGTLQDLTDVVRAEAALRDLADENLLLQRIAAAANESGSLTEALLRTGQLVVAQPGWLRARAFVPGPGHEAGTDGFVELGPALGLEADEVLLDGLEELEQGTAARALRERTTVWDEAGRCLAAPVLLDGQPAAVMLATSDGSRDQRRDRVLVGRVAAQLAALAERERAAAAIAAARDAAMSASRHKSEFLATMSHEIRTPLNGVIGLNELLQDTGLDAHQQRLVSGVAASARALLALVDDVLDFSKIEAGRLVLEDIEVDLREVLDDVAQMVAETATERRVRVVVVCDRAVPAVVRGDRVRLMQVLSNLVSNAVKFTRDGDVVIRVRAAGQGAEQPPERSGEAAEQPHLVEFEVADTGVGIPVGRIDQVFEPFLQADSTTTREYGGTGLGLAIVHEIVEALGGEIGVESEVGVGSVFRFTVRLAAGAIRPGAALVGRRALLVAADDLRREALEETLSHWGMTVDATAGPLDEGPTRGGGTGTAPDVVVVDDCPGCAAAPERVGDRPMVSLRGATAVRAEHDGSGRCLPQPVGTALLRRTVCDLLGVSTPVEAPPASDQAPASTGARVLVVEDTPMNQLVAEGVLRALGYACETADDGVVALERLSSPGPAIDLVLLDVQMPRMDGYATARALRERERAAGSPRLPVVAMTAAAVVGERERCLEAGMDDFLTKPVARAELAGVLARHLDTAATTVAPAAPSPAPGCGPGRDPADSLPVEVVEHLDLERLAVLRDMDPPDTSYLDRVIGNFATRSQDLADAIADAHTAGDAAAVAATAHRLKGSALNLGVPGVAALARTLEQAGEAEDLATASALLTRLDTALAQARTAVLAYRRSYGGAE